MNAFFSLSAAFICALFFFPQAEARESWLTCVMVDGQQAQVSLPKDKLRIRTQTGEWSIPAGTVREVKIIQQEGATEARVIYPNGFVTSGELLNRTFDIRTPANEKIKLNVRLLQSLSNPILGGFTREEEILTPDLPAAFTGTDNITETLALAYSAHRFRGADFTTELAVPHLRNMAATKSSQFNIETVYGDRLRGRFDPARMYAVLDGAPLTVNLRDVGKATFESDALDVGGGYLWWVMKNGNRHCARVSEGETAIQLQDGSRMVLRDIDSVRQVGQGDFEFLSSGTTIIGKPVVKKVGLNWLLDGDTRVVNWKDVDYVVLPGEDIGSTPASTVPPVASGLAFPTNPAETIDPVLAFPSADPVPVSPEPAMVEPFQPVPVPASVDADPFQPAPIPADLEPDPAISEFPSDPANPDAVPPVRKAITPPPDLAPDAWMAKCIENEFRETFVNGGSFKLGDTKNRGLADEQPAIAVDVRSYFMDITEVSKKAFSIFAQANRRYKTSAERGGALESWRAPGFSQRDDEPAVFISWRDAVEYCNWRSKKMGLEECYRMKGGVVTCDRTKNGYRLPTEAEWEFAVREGGRDMVYPFGDEPSVADAVTKANFKQEQPGKIFDGYRFTSPPGSFPANRLGIYDLTGNVWEWCEDYYHKEAYYFILSREKNDPCVEFPDAPRLSNKVMRGGSWEKEKLDFLRVSSRGNGPPLGSKASVGFRCVRTAP